MNNILSTRDIKNILPQANIFLFRLDVSSVELLAQDRLFIQLCPSLCIAVRDSYKSWWMRKQAARRTSKHPPRDIPVFLSFRVLSLSFSFSRLSVLIPTKGPLPHTTGSTGRGKWKTHRANTIHPRRPKHVAGWILPMKGGGSGGGGRRRCGVRCRNDLPRSCEQSSRGSRADEGGW